MRLRLAIKSQPVLNNEAKSNSFLARFCNLTQIYQSRGSLYLETKAYELAICDYHATLKLNPNLNGAQKNLAKAKVQLRRLEKPKNPHIQDEINLLLQKYRHENTLIKQRYLGLTLKERD